jgi:hypothetical protein
MQFDQEIWENSNLLVTPPNTFSSFVIERSELMLKSFLNAWTRAQE